jgi:hypothetical protein
MNQRTLNVLLFVWVVGGFAAYLIQFHALIRTVLDVFGLG